MKKTISLILTLAILSAFPATPPCQILSAEVPDSLGEIKNPLPADSTHVNGGTHESSFSYVYFGHYPQSRVLGAALTSNIIYAYYDSNGNAVVDGVKYRRLHKDMASEIPNSDGYFDWKELTYLYFRYEPIRWRVLEIENGKAFLAAENVLDTQKFRAVGGTSEKWETSTVRAWLNGTGSYSADSKNFLTAAFNTNQAQYIQETYLENKNYPASKVSSGEDTQDEIFLLSYSDLETEKYGHCLNQTTGTCVQHRRVGSDYAWAMGGQKDPLVGRSAYKDMIGYLTRTAGELYGNVTGVSFMGKVGGAVRVPTGEGIVPAMVVSCNEETLHKVSFNTSGGSNIASQYYIGSSQAIRPAVPVKKGFDFAGWYADPNYTKVYNFASAVSSDTIVYARWSLPQQNSSDTSKTTTQKPDTAAKAVKPKVTSPKKTKISVKRKKKLTLKIKVKNMGKGGKLTYQWQASKKQKSGFKNIKGKAKKTSYKPSTKKKGRIFYRCRVTHTVGKSSKNRVSKVFRVTVK
ncbi:MAG: InlB B-repeat-containing protein [Oscillospiraceae bacterium]|nr:InlB B-repeat-containing protein [Oscillospiraceae bacterium]